MSSTAYPNEKEWSLLRALLGEMKPSWTKMAADNTLPPGMSAAQASTLWFAIRKKFFSGPAVAEGAGQSSTSPRKKTGVSESPRKRSRVKSGEVPDEHGEQDDE